MKREQNLPRRAQIKGEDRRRYVRALRDTILRLPPDDNVVNQLAWVDVVGGMYSAIAMSESDDGDIAVFAAFPTKRLRLHADNGDGIERLALDIRWSASTPEQVDLLRFRRGDWEDLLLDHDAELMAAKCSGKLS